MSAAVQQVTGRDNVTDLRAAQLQQLIRRRMARARHFNPQLFADPAWDILLDLGFACLSGEPLAYRAAAYVPPGSIKRWIGLLAAEGLAEDIDGTPHLSDAGLRAISAWLSGR